MRSATNRAQPSNPGWRPARPTRKTSFGSKVTSLLFTAMLAQSGHAASLSGTVVIRGAGPLMDATVRVDLPGGRNSIATRTDHSGAFTINGVGSEKVLLTIERGSEVLYQAVVKDIKSHKNLNIVLEPLTNPGSSPIDSAPTETLDERTYHRLDHPELGRNVYAYLGEYHHAGSFDESHIYIVRTSSPLRSSSGLMREADFLQQIHDSGAQILTQMSFRKEGDRQRFDSNGKRYEIVVTRKKRGEKRVTFTISPA